MYQYLLYFPSLHMMETSYSFLKGYAFAKGFKLDIKTQPESLCFSVLLSSTDAVNELQSHGSIKKAVVVDLCA